MRLQAARESSVSGNEEGDQPHADAGETAAVEGLAEIEPEFDIDENAAQARNLVTLVMWLVWGIGLWLIWTDVLPALKALDSQPIFSNQVADAAASMTGTAADPPAQTEPVANGVTTIVPGGNGTNETAGMESTTSQLTQVTYGDILLFLVIAAITLAAARNLPSVLEMVFLNQLPFDRSVRYAIKALISYGIVLVGTILAFRALSISWSNVQWLATALTFGLAFGLQEIFANFVAGIILMFERPMRIGDWITIDGFTGMVTRIRTRATTIVNLERKEFVIPNKDFITGRLVNWTLSDAINRIDVTVGVAYGSEVEKAKEILLEIAAENPKIVEEPPPSVIFQEFGNSSLNLALRCFLKDIDSRMPTIDDLHTKINRAFEKAHITISFPQRDLHLRSIDEGLAKSLASAGNGATVHRASQS